jgi:Bacterial Ig-like domain (group 3)/Bacterial Ig domain
MHSLKQISNTGRTKFAPRASAWLNLLLQWWMLCCLGLAPLLANAGCFLDGNEWFCSAPDIYIQSPSNGQSIVTGTPVTVVVNAYDYAPDGAQHTSLIYEIRLYVNGTYTQVQRYSPNATEATAQFALGALAAGSYTLKATVMDQQGRERSDQVQITVAGPVLTTTQTSIVASPNPVQVGRSTTLVATVAGGAPTGSITFKQDGQVGTAVAMSGAQASFPMSFQNVGWYYVMATYSGDSKHLGSSTALLKVVVEKRQTAVALSASTATATINGPVTLTAAVDGSSPSGTVTFKSGGADLQTVSVTNGAASLTTSFSSAGSRAITAVYNGDANNAASSSNAVGVGIISPASVGLVASTALPTVGQTVTYTASVTGASPTGSIQFYENGAPKGGAVALSSGKATISISYETAGARTIRETLQNPRLRVTANAS